MIRKLIVASVLPLCLFIASCGGKKAETGDETPAQLSTEQQIAIGKILVDDSDCKTCHHATNRIIGPSHTEVAEKYEFTDENIRLLARRIIEGGSGVWGDVPMTAHPDVSPENAERMAMYVLSLDGEKKK
jgi:cytochrome c